MQDLTDICPIDYSGRIDHTSRSQVVVEQAVPVCIAAMTRVQSAELQRETRTLDAGDRLGHVGRVIADTGHYSISTRAHVPAADIKGTRRQALGRSRGGFALGRSNALPNHINRVADENPSSFGRAYVGAEPLNLFSCGDGEGNPRV